MIGDEAVKIACWCFLKEGNGIIVSVGHAVASSGLASVACRQKYPFQMEASQASHDVSDHHGIF